MSYITALGTASPPHRIPQGKIADFMARAMELDEYDARKLRTIFKASGIAFRHSVLADYAREKQYDFYPNTDVEPFPSTQKRLHAFKQYALPLSINAVENLIQKYSDYNASSITHLIVVSCTGMYAPGLDIELVKALGLSTNVQRTCITFMGCYAAFNALKVADAFCKADNEAKVLVVCTELCSLHFQKERTDNNFLANALFADGSAAAMVEANPVGSKSFSIDHFHNDLALLGKNDMAWTIGNVGFEMHLSSYVPGIIKSGIRKLTDGLLNAVAKTISDIKYFVIHPGGKRILETIEQQLQISRLQNEPAYQVLNDFGNMSSPTVLFVLNELHQSLKREDHNEYVLSFAFGPGLTLESMLLQIKIQ